MNKQFGLFNKVVVAVTLATVSVIGITAPATHASQVQVKDYHQHAYRQQIEYAIKNKLMWLYPDGNFRPDQPITQVDLVTSLVSLKGLTQGVPVPGLPQDFWARSQYERAYKDGILEGVEVNPSKVLNREEVAVIINNAWNKYRQIYRNPKQVKSQAAVAYGWIPAKSGYFINGVSTTKYDGISHLTRAELAKGLELLHHDKIGIEQGEIIATKFHESLKISGGYLMGTIPSVRGKDIRLLVGLKNNNVLTYKSGDIRVVASQIDYMEFTVKNSGQAKALAFYTYTYNGGTSLNRNNSR